MTTTVTTGKDDSDDSDESDSSESSSESEVSSESDMTSGKGIHHCAQHFFLIYIFHYYWLYSLIE